MRRHRILVTAPEYFDEDARRILREVGDLRVGRFTRSGLIREVKDASAVLIRVDTRMDSEVIASARRLRVIASGTTGTDHIDMERARRRGIRVVHLRGMHTRPTAEHTLALILASVRNILPAHASVTGGRWTRWEFMGTLLKGRVLGVIGLGRIGREVARLARRLGMRVQAYDPYVSDGVFSRYGVERSGALHGLLASSDIVSIHAALTPETSGMLGAREISAMKGDAVLVNTARGRIVDPEALVDALSRGIISGAAVDVYPDEPPPPHDPLVRYAREHDNLILTPHIAASTRESVHAVGVHLARRVREILTGPERT